MKKEFKMIEPVAKYQLEECVKVIRLSFETVANDFNLTTENCPSHPSFMQLKQLEDLFEKGVLMYCLIENGTIQGFVAIEQPNNEVPCWYIEKVSVIPHYRHKGLGEKLVKFAISEIEQRGGSYISIALIAEQTVLKNWYSKLGFNEFLNKQFEHLPFGVCFMEHLLFSTRKVSGNSTKLKHLISELDNDLRERNGDAQIHGVDLTKIEELGITFFIGFFGKEAICCGALRPYNEKQAELKRMFVKKEYRGKGFSKILYQKLENTALELGFEQIILETSKKQIEALGLYQEMGFNPTPKFGEYIDDENSMCFIKQI